MQKILIIGGAGYIGSYLTYKLLEKKFNVTVIDSFKNSDKIFNYIIKNSNLKVIRKDARDLEKRELKLFDTIIPLAALVGAPLCKMKPFEARSINLELIDTIIKKLSSKQKIIFPTTNSGYGSTSGDLKCDENTPLNPVSLYGVLKKEAENLVNDVK